MPNQGDYCMKITIRILLLLACGASTYTAQEKTITEGMTPAYAVAVNPLTHHDVTAAATVLRKDIRTQKMLGVVSSYLCYGLTATVLYSVLMERLRWAERTQEAHQLVAHYQQQFPQAAMPALPQQPAVQQPAAAVGWGTYLGDQATALGWNVITLPRAVGVSFFNALPMITAGLIFNAIQQYFARFMQGADYPWFMHNYTNFDELYLELLKRAAILDHESALLRMAKVGFLHTEPTRFSQLASEELAGYLKTVAVNNDHTTVAHAIAIEEMNIILRQMQLQYAYLLAFCQLQPIDSCYRTLMQQHGRRLIATFNELLRGVAYPDGQGLLHTVMMSINKQQEVTRSLMITTFPQEINRIRA